MQKKPVLLTHTEAFEREIQPRKMVKSLCESVAVLQLEIFLK